MTPHDMGKLIYTLQQNKIFNARQTRPILHEFGTQEYPEEYRYLIIYNKKGRLRINHTVFQQDLKQLYNWDAPY